MNINHEYHQYKMVMKIKYNLIRELCNPKYKKCHYEIQNILERLLISLVNNRSNKNKLFYKINDL